MIGALREQVREDLLWYRPATLPNLLMTLLKERTFRPVFTLRLVQHVPRGLRPFFAAAHRWTCAGAGVDLPNRVVAGPGLKLTHGWGLVVSPQTVIGRNVTLMHGVTLGGRGGKAPVIGDDAWIGPNSSVLGGVHVGEAATVSAGCVIVRDVAPGTMVSVDTSAIVHRSYRRRPEKVSAR